MDGGDPAAVTTEQGIFQLLVIMIVPRYGFRGKACEYLVIGNGSIISVQLHQRKEEESSLVCAGCWSVDLLGERASSEELP